VELGGIRIDRCEMDSGRLLLLARAVGCAAVSSELRVVVKRRSSHENGIDTVLFDSVKHPEWKAPVVSEGPPATKLSVPFSRPPELSPVLLIALSGRCAGGVDRAQGDWTCRL
jgi:hypothetical protein